MNKSVYYDFVADRMIFGVPGQITAKVVDYHLEYQSPDPFGQLKACAIRICAPLQEVAVQIGSSRYVELTILNGLSPPICDINVLDDADSLKHDMQNVAGELFSILLYVKAPAGTSTLQAVALLLRR
jgi:hypothetical protein